jgi:hypothetical protein
LADVVFEEVRVFCRIDVFEGKLAQAFTTVGIGCRG